MKGAGFLYILIAIIFAACSTQRPFVEKRYSPPALREDFKIFRGALEEAHPSLYWFTPKDSVDMLFHEASDALVDSMTERQFRIRLQKIVSGIRCGHTTINYSKRYSKYLDTANLSLFPLAFKIWEDTMAITANLHKDDKVLTRGTMVTAINDYPAKVLIDTFFQYITSDGFAITGKYQSLSSYGSFGVLYKNIFGLSDSFKINYIDRYGLPAETTIPAFKPVADSIENDSLKPEKYTPKERRTIRTYSSRNIQVDTTLKSAYMSVNTFARGKGLRRFFKYTFKNVQRLKLEHLVIDVRSNGGGDASNAILLTQYLTDHPFIIADSLYAIKRSSRFREYIKMQPLYWLATMVITKKRKDGNFHFGYFERHRFKPRKKYHYNGNVYILTGGNSFSATTLFAEELKGQGNVTIVGEETGGGAYGNTAWLLPQLTLPNTKLRVTIPKFRLVMRKDLVQEGRGVLPDVYAAPTIDDIRRGVDAKIEAVKSLITK